MRAVLVRPGPRFSVEDVANGYLEALISLGVTVVDFELGDAMAFAQRSLEAQEDHDDTGHDAARVAAMLLRGSLFDWWPDLVIVVSAFFLPPEFYDVVRSRGIKIAMILTESPYEDEAQYGLAARADLAIVNDPTNLDTFRQRQPNTVYLPHAYRPMHKRGPVDPELASQFCFVGTGYPSRITFFESVDFSGIETVFAGNWQDLEEHSKLTKFLAHDRGVCLPNPDAVAYYSSCDASANLYRTESISNEVQGWAMGPREVELAATETFFLTQARGENREALPMVPTFEGPEDFAEKLRWWLSHPNRREDVARRARAAVSKRTFQNNARDLLAGVGL